MSRATARSWAAASVVALAAFALASSALASDPVNVRADRLEVQREQQRASFEGNVVATYGAIELRCTTLEVRYDSAGKVQQLTAQGGVTVRSGEAMAKAQRATLEPRRGALVLDGSAQLSQGGHRLSGARITVHLATGRLEVEQAMGSFELDLGQGSPP